MDETGTRICVPRNDDPTIEEQPLLDFQAGYVLRSLDMFPKQGSKAPWKLSMSYPRDVVALRFGSVTDVGMKFENPPAGGLEDPGHAHDRDSVAA
jgi:hypothetical protein